MRGEKYEVSNCIEEIPYTGSHVCAGGDSGNHTAAGAGGRELHQRAAELTALYGIGVEEIALVAEL